MAFVASGIQVHVHESKFALLMQDSDSGEEEDSESWKKVGKSKKALHSKESEGSTKAAQKNAKKRTRKKKSRQLSNSTDNTALEREDGEDTWQQRNQEAADMEYHRNLEEAILNSMAEDQERKQVVKEEELTHKPSRTKKRTTLTLQELHRTTDFATSTRSTEGTGKQEEVEETKNDSAFFDMVHASVQEQTERDKQQKRRDARSSSSSNSKGSVDLTNNGPVEESARVAHLKDIVEKKEQEIAKLSEQNERSQRELQEVKKRNQILCRILSQGEIAAKSDLIRQIDELTSTRDDLTKEVEQLHSSLEQERSKNKQLRAENLKLQGLRGSHKH